MSADFADVSSQAQSARTVEEMIAAVQDLKEWPSLRAIPYLAKLDRRATGWLFALTGWLAVALATMVVIACLLAFWLAIWALAIQTSIRLIDRLHPAFGLWATVAAIALAAWILYHDPRLHKLVAERLSLSFYGLARPLQWSLQVARVLIYLNVVLVVGGLLAVVCAVGVLTALDWGAWIVAEVQQPDGLPVYFWGRHWLVGLSVTILVALAAQGLRSLREHGILVAVGFFVGAWGLMRLVLATNSLWPGQEWFTVGIVLGIAALYPSRLPFVVVQAMTLPLRWLTRNAERLTQRLRLRKLLWTAVRHHRQQNVSRTGKKWKLALCSDCLARLEREQERLAYQRRLRYAWCRKCHSDEACYQNVRQAEGWLDQEMSVSQEQVGETVRINLLNYLDEGSKPLPLDLDTVVIAEADDYQVEAFLTLYQERGRGQPIQPLSRLAYRMEPNASIGPNIRAMLQDTFDKQEENA